MSLADELLADLDYNSDEEELQEGKSEGNRAASDGGEKNQFFVLLCKECFV